MARLICLPALATSAVALVAFFACMEPRYRWSFYAHDSRYKVHRRHWEEAAERPECDADRAAMAISSLRYVGDPVYEWIEKGVAGWERSPPEWYTAAWREGIRAQAHLLGESGAGARALALMRSASVEGDGVAEDLEVSLVTV
jgi:hypothetical protein